MQILKELIQKYSHCEFVDIESIVKEYGIELDYVDFEKINGIIVGDRIGINKNIEKFKQRFTIAHELCHFLLEEKGASSGPFASVDFREKRADTFAMELLLPEKAILEAYENHENIPELASIFGVPKNIIEKRLKTLLKTKHIGLSL